jgi:hypothetical protein
MPDALDDAALLERIDSAIADGRRLLDELGQLRAAVAARASQQAASEAMAVLVAGRAA